MIRVGQNSQRRQQRRTANVGGCWGAGMNVCVCGWVGGECNKASAKKSDLVRSTVCFCAHAFVGSKNAKLKLDLH